MLDIKIWSSSLPGVSGVSGGTILVTDNGDGTYQLTSSDTITVFVMDTNKTDITKVQIISEELTSLYNTFNGLTNMTEFVASSSAFGDVTNFFSAWESCSSLTSFPAIDTSSGVDFSYAWALCSSISCMQAINTSSANHTKNMFNKCTKLCRPSPDTQSQLANTPGINWVSDVPAGSNCCFNIKITSPSLPGVSNVSDGTITVTDNGDGTYQLTSVDAITAFRMDTNKADITRVEIISETLSSLDLTFYGLSNMTEFVASSTAFGATKNFLWAWRNCSSLASFPLIDTSKGDTFNYAWAGCSALTSFPAIDTSDGQFMEYVWSDCSSLKCMQAINTLTATSTKHMFYNSLICRPNPMEQSQLTGKNGKNWVSDVAYGANCCYNIHALPVATYKACHGNNCN